MANANGWGDGASNNNIGWGKGADNAIGWGSVYSVSEAGATDIVGTPAVDPDAQAFITAAAITDPTQQAAINTLVVDLKGYSIWTKMKAVYPFVGSTASQHKFNLKDPRDLDAAFRLVFSGGWTHSVNGALPNGTNAYADTKLNLSTQTTLNDIHLGFYSRTHSTQNAVDIGAATDNINNYYLLQLTGSTTFYIINESAYITYPNFSDTDTKGFYVGTRSGTVVNGWKNGIKRATKSPATTAARPNQSVFLSAYNQGGASGLYSNRQLAFSSIGDGLTDTEALNFYTAVQAFQTTLGRSIGTQTVSDTDAQAFVTNADIVDQVEANAINNLVIGMKADGLWTKMKAVYPFVGGTATSHSYNLVNTAQYQITWNGGVTHSNLGVQGNGTNGYGNTGLNDSSVMTLNNAHISIYSRTNSDALYCDMGVISGSDETTIFAKYTNTFYPRVQNTNNGITNSTSSQGLFIANRVSSTEVRAFQNGTLKLITNNSSAKVNLNHFICAASRNGDTFHSARQYAFSSIGDGLTDTEAANFYTAVQAFQTSLNRNI